MHGFKLLPPSCDHNGKMLYHCICPGCGSKSYCKKTSRKSSRFLAFKSVCSICGTHITFTIRGDDTFLKVTFELLPDGSHYNYMGHYKKDLSS